MIFVVEQKRPFGPGTFSLLIWLWDLHLIMLGGLMILGSGIIYFIR